VRIIAEPGDCQGGGDEMNQQDKRRGSEQSSVKKRDQIDEQLKRVYNETAAEPLPERFVELLNQLRAQDRD
jgi:hypothetical protein